MDSTTCLCFAPVCAPDLRRHVLLCKNSFAVCGWRHQRLPGELISAGLLLWTSVIPFLSVRLAIRLCPCLHVHQTFCGCVIIGKIMPVNVLPSQQNLLWKLFLCHDHKVALLTTMGMWTCLCVSCHSFSLCLSSHSGLVVRSHGPSS